MENKEAQTLLLKYEKGKCTKQEMALLESWFIKLKSGQTTHGLSDQVIDEDLNEVWLVLKNKHLQPKKLVLWPRIAVAAALVAIVFGIWFFSPPAVILNLFQDPNAIAMKNDIAPGSNKATITLANGKTITLSDKKTGVVIGASKLSYNDGTTIFNDGATILSSGADAKNSLEPGVTRVSTPRSGTYQVRLPDGSNVWLNAASSISYTAALNKPGSIREVELSGEAYFEIFKDKEHPFVVNSKKMELTVLGTHFNVNAYDDEKNIKTTLLEGSVRVVNYPSFEGKEGLGKAIILKPAQQAVITANKITVEEVDTELAVAWKDNKFIFERQGIREIMRAISRWYDVEVIYLGEPIKETFWGSVSRFDNVSKVLRQLEASGNVHFKIEGRKIYVSP